MPVFFENGDAMKDFSFAGKEGYQTNGGQRKRAINGTTERLEWNTDATVFLEGLPRVDERVDRLGTGRRRKSGSSQGETSRTGKNNCRAS